MALALNLKKILNDWVDKILAELSLAYIQHQVKPTLKRQGNSSSKEFLPSHLTTEHRSTTIVTSSPDTSEKIIMKLDKTDDIIDQVRDWSVDKIESAELVGDKIALYAEFEEWIELDDETAIEILSSGTKVDKDPKK